MVDTPKPEDTPKEEKSSPDVDNDFGEDWESAFQAEDYIFSPDDGEGEDIFLGEDEGTEFTETSPDIPLATAQSSADEEEKQEEQKTAGESETEAPAGTAGSQESFPAVILTRLTPFLSKTSAQVKPLRERFNSLKLYQRGVVLALPILLFLYGAATLFSPEENVTETPPYIPHSSRNQIDTAQAGRESTQPDKDRLQQADLPIKKTRAKWTFSPFFVPTPASDGDRSTALITVNLELVVLLDEGETIPEEKRTFVRNTIYQFYSNRPLKELNRYSLARGEMKRKLEAWLLKQWPDSPIDTIIIHRFNVS